MLCVQRLALSLLCQTPDKVLHVFLYSKWPCFICFLQGRDSFHMFWDYSHFLLWIHKNKVHGSLCYCVGCSFESYFCWACATRRCTTKGHPVVFSFEKGQNKIGDCVSSVFWIPCLPSVEYSEGITYKFTQEKQVLDTVDSMSRLSSFTQPSFESKIVFMAKDSILVICVYAYLCAESCPKNASVPLFDRTRVGSGLLLYNNSLTPMILLWWTLSIGHGSLDD
jgi:hypothetical protein